MSRDQEKKNAERKTDRRWLVYITIATATGLVCWIKAWLNSGWTESGTVALAFVAAVYLMLAVLAILVLSDTLVRKAYYFRPRFSMRNLVIVLTLVCAYFGAWAGTRQSVEQDEYSPIPFVIARVITREPAFPQRTRYDFWFCGMRIKLFESLGDD